MQRIFITGATGLVGSNMCRVASEAGFVPRALVRPGSSTKALEALGAELAWGDIRDEGAVDAAVAGCAHVVHTAALVPGPTPATREDFEAINVTGTRHVVAAAERHGAESLVHFSTSIHEVDGSLQSPERRVDPMPPPSPPRSRSCRVRRRAACGP